MSASSFLIGGKALAPPLGLNVTNFLDDEVLGFEGRDRHGRVVNEIILHESVTRTAISTVAVLKRRKLGVHLIVALTDASPSTVTWQTCASPTRGGTTVRR